LVENEEDYVKAFKKLYGHNPSSDELKAFIEVIKRIRKE
jgi:hypothetical protein